MNKEEERLSDRLQAFLGKAGIGGHLYEKEIVKPTSLQSWQVDRGEWVPARQPTSARVALEGMKGVAKSIEVGHVFGKSDEKHWVMVTATIPKEWTQKRFYLRFDCECEATVFSGDGKTLLQGVAGATGEDRRVDVRIDASMLNAANNEVSLLLEVACSSLFGNGAWVEMGPAPPDPNKTFALKICEFICRNEAAWSLYYDLRVIADMAKHLPTPSDGTKERCLRVANNMVNLIDLEDSSTWARAAELAADFFEGAPMQRRHRLTAAGHAHIDTAWLWNYEETRRKVARTWANQLRLMDEHAQYRFVASQAQQYAWLKEDYPELFERVRQRVAEGRFVPVGGTWVELDGNLPSGESMVRQFVYGQRFFESEFGVRCRTFFLPDTFGYCAQFPQIMRSVGIERFLTQKLSWNDTNKMPHNTFQWHGLDGSAVLTHFPPTDTYCSHATVKDALFTVHNHADKAFSSESLLLFGHGDGGGGPNEGMLHMLDRMRDTEALPRVRFDSIEQFYDDVTSAAERCALPTWHGELYFEKHRGTYTSQAGNKLSNRQCETRLHHVEALLALAATLQCGDSAAVSIDAELAALEADVERCWKVVLTNQFHDVIPGSSIASVYVDTRVMYKEIDQTLERIGDDLERLLTTWLGEHRRVNTLGAARFGVAPFGVFTPCESSEERDRVLRLGCTVSQARDTGAVLENALWRAEFGANGLVSLRCKHDGDRELLFADNSPRLVVYDDYPQFWDAWDVESYLVERGVSAPLESLALEADAVRLCYRLSARSRVLQHVYLSEEFGVVFDTEVVWDESHKMLKAEFPVRIHQTEAIYDVPFGFARRPTHRNTSWDAAKFETCGHRFACVEEFGRGVALLNNCKYGYSARDRTLALSLLRAPKHPDADCDIGTHRFVYSLLPYSGGDFRQNRVQQRSASFQYAFDTLLALPAEGRKKERKKDKKGKEESESVKESLTSLQPSQALIECSTTSVMIDTLKLGFDKKSLIFRVFEQFGGECRDGNKFIGRAYW